MKYFIVDAFTAKPFGGNPAAVVMLENAISDSYMQAIAQEFNLAETAFLLKITNQRWSLRWFTPTMEMDLCGHATLASAHTLWRELQNNEDQLAFETLSGDLFASRKGEKIELNFPSIELKTIELEEKILDQLNLAPIACYSSHHDLLLEVDNEKVIQQYQPDFSVIAQLQQRGLIITAKSKSKIDFVSRFFAPKLGIPEDPVTGAIHCVLAPYWGEKLGKQSLVAKQLSKRGGELGLRLDTNKVFLAGDSITTMAGELRR